MANVVLIGIGASLVDVGVSLNTATLEMACIGPSLRFPNDVSLVTFLPAPPPSGDIVFDFSKATSSMYVPLLAGFA